MLELYIIGKAQSKMQHAPAFLDYTERREARVDKRPIIVAI